MTCFILPLLIVAFYFICLQTLCYQQDLQILPSVTVHIISEVPNTPSPLRFRCQSKDDDLGTHTLNTSQEFNWKFTPNIFGRTLFFCHFYWDDKDKSFDVFNYKLSPLCSGGLHSDCYWVVKPDGFYLSDNKSSLGSKVNYWT